MKKVIEFFKDIGISLVGCIFAVVALELVPIPVEWCNRQLYFVVIPLYVLLKLYIYNYGYDNGWTIRRVITDFVLFCLISISFDIESQSIVTAFAVLLSTDIVVCICHKTYLKYFKKKIDTRE